MRNEERGEAATAEERATPHCQVEHVRLSKEARGECRHALSAKGAAIPNRAGTPMQVTERRMMIVNREQNGVLDELAKTANLPGMRVMACARGG